MLRAVGVFLWVRTGDSRFARFARNGKKERQVQQQKQGQKQLRGSFASLEDDESWGGASE